MPKITNEERDRQFAAQRDAILQAAWRCFNRNTTIRTSMEDVEREAGVTPATLYLHYQSKDELVRAVMESSLIGFENIIRQLAASDAGSTRIGLLTAILETAHGFGIRSDGVNLFRLCAQSWAYAQTDVGMAEVIRSHYAGFIDFYTQLGQRRWGLSAKDARVHGVLIETIILGYILQVSLGTGVTAEEHIAAYRQLGG